MGRCKKRIKFKKRYRTLFGVHYSIIRSTKSGKRRGVCSRYDHTNRGSIRLINRTMKISSFRDKRTWKKRVLELVTIRAQDYFK